MSSLPQVPCHPGCPCLSLHHATEGPHGLTRFLAPASPTSLLMPPVCTAVACANASYRGSPSASLPFTDRMRQPAQAVPACSPQAPAPQHTSPAHLLTGTHMGAPKPMQPEGYFHSTMLMHAFRSGFCRVKQNRALAGRGAAGGTGFLDFSFCCLFFMSSWGEAGSMMFLP